MTTETERLLRIEQVSALVGLKRSAIYARIADEAEGFPKPIPLSDRCNVWPESAIRAWIHKQIQEREQRAQDKAKRRAEREQHIEPLAA